MNARHNEEADTQMDERKVCPFHEDTREAMKENIEVHEKLWAAVSARVKTVTLITVFLGSLGVVTWFGSQIKDELRTMQSSITQMADRLVRVETKVDMHMAGQEKGK